MKEFLYFLVFYNNTVSVGEVWIFLFVWFAIRIMMIIFIILLALAPICVEPGYLDKKM